MTRLRVYLWLFLIGTMRLVHNSQILCPGGKGLKITVNLIFWMKQTSSICPVWAEAQPQLRRRAGCEEEVPMGCGAGGPGAGAGGCLLGLPWPPPQQPLDPTGCLLPGQGHSPYLRSVPGSLHKSVKETWGVQNSRAKSSFRGKKRNRNKTAKPQTRILRWAETQRQ